MTRAMLCLAIAASPAIASTPTVEVVGYTDAGEFVRLRGVMIGASYVSCPAGPCLDVVAGQVVVVGDAMFADGFETVPTRGDGVGLNESLAVTDGTRRTK